MDSNNPIELNNAPKEVNNTLAITTPATNGISRLKSWFDIVAASTILIAMMGIPATVNHYSSLNIPISLLSYRRILEAGFIPAIIMFFFLSFIIFNKPTLKETSEKFSRLIIPAIPFLLPVLILCFAFIIFFWSYLFWFIGWIITRPLIWFKLNWPLENYILFITGIIVVMSIIIPVLYHTRKKKKKEKQALSPANTNYSDNKSREKQKDIIEDIFSPNTLFKWFRNALYSYLTIPLTIIGFVYFIRLSCTFYGITWPSFLTSKVIWIISILCGFAYAHYTVLIMELKQINYKYSEIKLIKISRYISYTILFLSYISIYSLFIYPILPRSLGGGKPQKVNLLVTNHLEIENVSKLVVSVDNSNRSADELIEYSNLLLVDVCASEVIICLDSEHPKEGIAISRDIVKAIKWNK
jgi:hypothetical protein